MESVEENSKWKTVVNETVLRVQDLIEKVKVPSKHVSSKMSTRLSHHSKHSVLRSEGAVKQISETMLKHSELLASAKARLKFAEEEAALLKHEAELQANKMTLKTKRDVEEAKCNLEALYEMSDLGGSYEPPPTVDDHQDEDVGFERMKSYVNSLEKGSYSSAPVQDCDVKTENKSESGPPHGQLNVGAEPYNPQINRNTYSEFAKVFAKKGLSFEDTPF